MISLDEGWIEGVFRTKEPVARAADGTPCYILLRFYKDGQVLEVSLCRDVEAEWSEIEKWFNRDVAPYNGYHAMGHYQMEGNHIQSSMVGYDREYPTYYQFDDYGEIVGDHLLLRTKVPEHPIVGEHEFVPLLAAQL